MLCKSFGHFLGDITLKQLHAWSGTYFSRVKIQLNKLQNVIFFPFLVKFGWFVQ